MLGTGRPFVFEFINPKKSISGVEKLAGFSVNEPFVKTIGELKVVDKQYFDHMKEIESQKAKRYSAVCWIDRPLTDEDIEKLESLKDIKLAQ